MKQKKFFEDERIEKINRDKRRIMCMVRKVQQLYHDLEDEEVKKLYVEVENQSDITKYYHFFNQDDRTHMVKKNK